ncbi:hypothetical protein V1509DRAFT_640778 [Lipomyces kononenkoae]
MSKSFTRAQADAVNDNDTTGLLNGLPEYDGSKHVAKRWMSRTTGLATTVVISVAGVSYVVVAYGCGCGTEWNCFGAMVLATVLMIFMISLLAFGDHS